MSNAKYISSILFDNSLSENSYLNDLPIIKYLAANKELKLSSEKMIYHLIDSNN